MAKMTFREALALLDLEGLPSADVVRRAFRREALRCHPDKVSAAAACSQPNEAGASAAGPAQPQPAPAPAFAPLRPEPPAPPSDPAAASQPSVPTSREAAEERFKRLAAAYHLLLRAADGAAAVLTSAGGAGGARAAAGGAGPGSGHMASGFRDQGPPGQGPPGPRERVPDVDMDMDDEALADALSADLLLEARRLRLSDFDMVFLHQRASVGAAGLTPEWSDAVRDVDDLWRRIRRRLERRRQRRQAQAAAQAGHSGAGKGAGGTPGSAGGAGGTSSAALPGSKWSLLFEFMADVVGAEAVADRPDDEEGSGEEDGRVAGGSSSHEADGASSRAGAGGNRGGDEGGTVSALEARVDGGLPAAQAAQPPQPPHGRRRGRLPPGFYWRWLRRLVALQLVIGVLFKR